MSLVQPANDGAKPERNALQAGTTQGQSVIKRPQPTQLTSTDREFLPAALEILVTPPSPVARTLLLVICTLFAATLAWSYFGWIDIYAVAQGRIQPTGGSKVVQPIDPGRITAIHVENGSRVSAGQVLLELDSTEAAADREAQARDLEAASAEAARRKAAIAAAATDALQPLPVAFPANISEPVRQREEGVLFADLAQLRSTIGNLKAQLAEKQATRDKLTATIAEREKLIALAKERVEMRQRLDAMGAGSRAQTIESLEQYETQVTTDTGDRGQLIETSAAMASLLEKIRESVASFVADQSQKLAAAEQKRDHLEQDLIKAQSKASHTALKAPIAGTVQQLAVTSLGQVVASGQPLLTVVPGDGTIDVRAMVANDDIGFVKAGQPAVVKVDAFPFTRYGTIGGTVARVSNDAVDERAATELTDAATAARPQGAGTSTPPRAQNLVFPATIRLAQRTIDIDGKEVDLIPGMAVTVEIKTGQRRAIDYLLSPLREVVSGAAHER